MKQVILLLLLAVMPLAFAGEYSGALKAAPRWERNIALLPETIKETLAIAFPTYIIVEFARVARGDYKILLQGAEDAIYVVIDQKGDVVDEKGTNALAFDYRHRHIIVF